MRKSWWKKSDICNIFDHNKTQSGLDIPIIALESTNQVRMLSSLYGHDEKDTVRLIYNFQESTRVVLTVSTAMLDSVECYLYSTCLKSPIFNHLLTVRTVTLDDWTRCLYTEKQYLILIIIAVLLMSSLFLI